MNLRKNKEAQALIETLMALPLFLVILFFLLEFSFLTIAQRINEWACFRLARSLLPLQTNTIISQAEVHSILHKIPFSTSPPLIRWEVLPKEVSADISQTLFFLGRMHEIKSKFTLYR